MALKPKDSKTEETSTTTTTQETPADDNQTEQEQTGVAVRHQAGTVAVRQAGPSVFITNPDFVDAVIDADYGTFTSVVASNGQHQVSGSDVTLGKVIKFQGILVKENFKVVPGSNDEEAKEFFCVSDDGVYVKDGRTIEEALDDAKEAGYEKASIKKYIDIICVVKDCENPDFIGETITLQLAPSSQFTWKPIQGKCKMKAAMGKLEAVPVSDDPDHGSAVVFTSTATPTTWKGNSFTKFKFTID